MPPSHPWHARCDVSVPMRPLLRNVSRILSNAARAHRHLFVAGVVAIAFSIWTAVAGAGWLLAVVATGLPNNAALRDIGMMSMATTIFDSDDKPVFTIFKERRIEVPLSRVSPHLIDAIVSLEDQRFFDHGGVDIIRIGGAAWKNLVNGWGTQGGSTITQQLARQSFLTREKTLRRKLREIVLAVRLENTFSKAKLLELYLNKVYFGDGLYGVEAASLGYFGKHAADLEVGEAALLAGLVKAPSTYAPTVSMERAMARRTAALEAMRDAGRIDEPTFQQAVAQHVQLNDTLRGQEGYGRYFTEEVRKQLVQTFGWERVYAGGLKVYTTLNMDMQRAAEDEVHRAMTELDQRQGARKPGDSAQAEAALVSLDPRTGEVRALVGGRSFDESHFNRATQARRQAGSAFKPFVYAAALERGFTPATLIAALDQPIMTVEGAWLPDNHGSQDVMTMRAALKVSSNRAAVRMLQDIGIPAALQVAQRFGIESVPGVWSLALGSGEVTLLSMTAAYAAFANDGLRPAPIMIRRVETTEGEVLYAAATRAVRAVSQATAFLMTSMLSDVVNGGTAWQARRFGLSRPAAGKTGTTNDYRDAWFIGYTPELATGVWVGYDQPRTIIARGYAATLAVPLWGRFMARATEHDDSSSFQQPRTVTTATICHISGKLSTDACRYAVTYDKHGNLTNQPVAYTEYFVRGTEPVDHCDVHADPSAPSVPVAVAVAAPPAQPVINEGGVLSAVPTPVATTGIVSAGPAH